MEPPTLKAAWNRNEESISYCGIGGRRDRKPSGNSFLLDICCSQAVACNPPSARCATLLPSTWNGAVLGFALEAINVAKVRGGELLHWPKMSQFSASAIFQVGVPMQVTMCGVTPLVLLGLCFQRKSWTETVASLCSSTVGEQNWILFLDNYLEGAGRVVLFCSC